MTDHCGTGNTASPSFKGQLYDWDAGTVTELVSWRCFDCAEHLTTKTRTRVLVSSRPGYCGDGSDPDRGADPHLSGVIR